MTDNWVQTPTTSNLLKQTYVNDFLDIIGSLYLRNGSMNIHAFLNEMPQYHKRIFRFC